MEICDILMADIIARFMAGIRESGHDCDAATLVAVNGNEGVKQYGYLYDPQGFQMPWTGPADTRAMLDDYRALSSPRFPEPWQTCVIRLDHTAGQLDVQHLDAQGVPEAPRVQERHLSLVS